MQKAYNDDMCRNGKSQLSHQGIGFNSEGIPYELNQPPPHVEKQNSDQKQSKKSQASVKTLACLLLSASVRDFASIIKGDLTQIIEDK